MIKFRVVIFEKSENIKNFLKDSNLSIISCAQLYSDDCDIKKYSADVIIIDVSCFNKTDVFKYISENSDISIFAVNADESLKYQIYECGAVDVAMDPVDKIELKYKINILKKKNRYNPKKYYLGDLIYEIETGTLIKGTKSIVLPSLQNKIFALLLNGYYDNRIVKKEEIFTSMIDESSRIQNHIARLRYSLAYIKSRQVVIETVYGKGYKLLIINK